MTLRLLIVVLGIAFMPLAITRGSTPSVSISGSGFSPSQINTGDQTVAYFNADMECDGETIELPGSTYAWSIDSVSVDPNYGTAYQAATSGYTATISDSDQQNCALNASFDSGGAWKIIVRVTVTYPDGYCRTIIRTIFENSAVQIAGSAGGIATLRGSRLV